MEAVFKSEKRSVTGSRGCNKLRADGKVPAVLYGKGENMNISLDDAEVKLYFQKVRQKECEVIIDGDSVPVVIAEVQRHPITRDVQHIDFCRK